MEGTIGTSTGQWLLGAAVLLLLCGQVMCRPGSGLCPPEVPEVQCVRDPCQNAACPTYPAAVCRANYCGGCNADFYLGGKKVECTPIRFRKAVASQNCPKDKPLVQCLLDPCLRATCPRFPTAVCRANYCGGCNADFYLGGKKVECTPIRFRKALAPRICPKDKPLVQCLLDPCLRATCPRYPTAVCRANYCGGCNTEFFLSAKKVDCSLPGILPITIPDLKPELIADVPEIGSD